MASLRRSTISVISSALGLSLLVTALAGGAATATPAVTSGTVSSGASQPVSKGFPNDLEEGIGLSPARGKADVQALKSAQDSRLTTQRSAAVAAPVPLAPYNVSGIVQRPLAVGKRPYDNDPIIGGIRDSSGVRMFTVAGDPTLYNHPVGQAHLSMAALDSYRRTGNASHLVLAKANAQRLIDRRVESRGAWYYPYDFDFAVHGDTTQTLRAPWYSGMAQGVSLSAFTRLYDVTHDPAWLAAADATYASLDTGPVPGQPFGSWVSSTGDLWLEEYPREPVEASERVLNGHIYAAFGLYDYAQLTGSPAAKRLYDGALTTVARYLMTQFRTPKWASLYSLRHRLPTVTYHPKHIAQLLYLQNQTGRTIYTTWAQTLRDDFPVRTSAGFAVITPKTTVMYQLNGARQITSSRAVTFTRSTGAPVNRRERSHPGPIMLQISAGAYLGWWVPESYAKARIRGAVETHNYDPALLVTFASGTTAAAYKYDSLNQFVAYKAVTFTRSSQAPVTRSAIVDGQLSYYLPTGAFAGYWVAAKPGVTVR